MMNSTLIWYSVLLIFGPPLAILWGFSGNLWLNIFWTIFTLRYARLFGHGIGHLLYRAYPVVAEPERLYSAKDVTVILPVAQPEANKDLKTCLQSILQKKPAELYVVTTTDSRENWCKCVLEHLRLMYPDTNVEVWNIGMPNKRKQVASAVREVQTKIIITADDHVWWPSENFLPSILAPFQDADIGIVGTRKQVVRTSPGEWSWDSVLNFFACVYLEKHNWEYRSSSAVDSGLYVVSGRTAAYRADFFQDEDLLARFCGEKFFFGMLGGEGLGPDDDNFLTRQAFKKGWKAFFQDAPDATVWTTVGNEGVKKLRGQLSRWARTAFRSNPVMLRDPEFFRKYTWSYFMVYWARITNFALFWDAALVWALCRSVSGTYTVTVTDTVIGTGASASAGFVGVWALLCWIVLTKMVKIVPHFHRCPEDLALFPAQVAFVYVHSLFKTWALLTFWDCGWSGRKLTAKNGAGEKKTSTD